MKSWNRIVLQTVVVAAGTVSAITGRWASAATAAETKADTEAGFVNLLEGDAKPNWRGYAKDEFPAGWEVKDNTLHRVGAGGDIMTKKTYRSFDLRFDWKIAKNGNSGVMYRVATGDPAPYLSGPEYQVLDNEGHSDGQFETHLAGSLYDLIGAPRKLTKPVGEWNEARIVIDGAQLEHYLNGKKVVSIEFDGPQWKELVGKSKFKDWKRFGNVVDGHIDFQDHGDEVWYRNIRIKELGATK